MSGLKNSIIFFSMMMGLCSCNSKPRYSDFKESDFYEVQGIIISASQNDNYFDNSSVKNINFSYFLDRPTPQIGTEKNLDMFEAKNGYPLIVLVHKDDESISFYGRVGILDNLNEKEKTYLSKHIQNEIENLKQ
ncbi:hypothetical protein [Winogradskyella helgolandensis]|uniref:hypothetical protein n=1 Tax=Winogradskyella helgolandensis TaxID=2697010 RepID=UPI0015B95434|nr:hypothetical protein [Winogradskyella helgolandensis]